MRICTALALAAALAATGGCKKKKTEDTNKPVEGSNMAGSNMAGSSMAGSATTPAKAMTGDDIVKGYQACSGFINAGDMASFSDKCVADSYKSHDAMMGMDMSGKDALIKSFDEMKKTFADSKFEPQLILVNGHNVAAVDLMAGTVKANSMPTPDGKTGPAADTKIAEMFFHRLVLDDAGKATDEWSIADMGTMMGQLGMMPKPPKGMPAMTTRPAATAWPGAPIIAIAANDDKEKANVDAFKKTNDAFNAHDAAGAVAPMADDAVESDQADEKDVSGKAAIQKGTEEFMKAVPDGKVEVSEIWGAGDYVVSIGKFTGTMMKNPLTMEFVEIAQFKDGKLVKLMRFRNGMDVMKAMMGGGTPPPGGAPKDK